MRVHRHGSLNHQYPMTMASSFRDVEGDEEEEEGREQANAVGEAEVEEDERVLV